MDINERTLVLYTLFFNPLNPEFRFLGCKCINYFLISAESFRMIEYFFFSAFQSFIEDGLQSHSWPGAPEK
jgi:hypothetical protein